MKSLNVVMVFSLFAFSFASLDWETFKNHHGKRYGNPREEALRKEIFHSNLQRIEAHNERYQNGQESFSMGINQFGDMSESEYKKYILCLAQSKHHTGGYVADDSRLTLEDLPQTVNWTERGAVTRVKNQGECGSCWAFSSTGSLESQLFLKTGKLVELSEQNLVDCSASFGNNGCSGGLMENAFQYIQYNKGIDTEEGYPYEAKENGCRFKKEAVATTDSGYVKIPSENEKALQKAIAEIGPISVAIDASGSFQFYENGVYYSNECSSGELNHGVLAVGYGTENGTDYWLVKNSWGTTWGDQGYIKMTRNKNNNCGIATLASYPTL